MASLSHFLGLTVSPVSIGETKEDILPRGINHLFVPLGDYLTASYPIPLDGVEGSPDRIPTNISVSASLPEEKDLV